MTHHLVIRFAPYIPFILLFVAIISFSLALHNYFYEPNLTYEKGDFQLPDDELLWWIVIQNEGNAPAEDVKINIKIKNGNITDSNVIITKSLIEGEITEYQLFDEPDRKLSRKGSSNLEILLPYISNGLKYTINFNIKSGYDRDYLLIKCKNCKWEAKPYNNRPVSLYFFSFGLISGILLMLGYFKYFQKRYKIG